jgi:hypothetical protein
MGFLSGIRSKSGAHTQMRRNRFSFSAGSDWIDLLPERSLFWGRPPKFCDEVTLRGNQFSGLTRILFNGAAV